MTDPTNAPNAASSASGKKQAVILVHGMGEQMPMETLRGFVETMWVKDPTIRARNPTDSPEAGNPVWWKPDPRTSSFELSRVTTRHGQAVKGAPQGPRTDFYEFYWADLTDANTLDQLKDWFVSIMWRSPGDTPAPLLPLWGMIWTLTFVFGGLAFWKWAGPIFGLPDMPSSATTIMAVGAALYAVLIGAALHTFGDVARYVRAKPPNIAARKAIRERGLKLLRDLHDGPQHDYGRIILVGHSLGSIIAYDLIKLFWSERGEARTMNPGSPLLKAIRDCEAAAAGLAPGGDGLQRFRSAQSAVFQAMQQGRSSEKPWLISDFVTVGSPLTYASILLARDEAGLKQGIEERRFPACPPVPETGTGYVYGAHDRWGEPLLIAHHATPFAAVRWTNIYDRPHLTVFGDVISGPLKRHFGLGVCDRRVTIRSGFLPWSRLFTHTLYWHSHGTKLDAPLRSLRRALKLTR